LCLLEKNKCFQKYEFKKRSALEHDANNAITKACQNAGMNQAIARKLESHEKARSKNLILIFLG
jgi:hypothetical protein